MTRTDAGTTSGHPPTETRSAVTDAETEGAVDESPGGAAGLTRKLSWVDGFSMAMLMPNGIVVFLGAAIADLGAAAAATLIGITSVIGYLQNFLYYEMAMMFPDETGGIALYANRAWRRHCSFVGPLAAFGYWLGWALTGAVVGETLGAFVQSEWFSGQTRSLSAGPLTLSFPQAVAVGVILVSFLINANGVKVASQVYRVVAVLYGLFAVAVMFLPFTHHAWSASHLHWHPGGSFFTTALVWMYVSAWTVYGTEICATFAPEYNRPRFDTKRALRASALFTLGVFVLCPLSTTGQLGEHVIANNTVTFAVIAMRQIFGTWITQVLVVIIVGELLLTVFASSGDAGRALLGMANRGLTLRQVTTLNRRGEPGRALILDTIINCLVVLLVKSPLAALFASNLGYLLATIAAVSGFLILRWDRPDAHRPVRLSAVWVPIAGVILVLDVLMTYAGVTHPTLDGYGSTEDVLVGLGILLLSLVVWMIRRVVQDKKPMAWRDRDDDHLAPAGPVAGGG